MRRILFMLNLAFCMIYAMNAQTYSVTLKVIDETRSLTIGDNTGTNVIVSVSEELASQNPRDPAGDWWYPMYDTNEVSPAGTCTDNGENLSWEISFTATPGEYYWIPYLKSLGWKFLNNSYLYSADMDNPLIHFTVNENGTVSGTTELVIPAEQPKFVFTVQVIDMTAGLLTNDYNNGANTDQNVFMWISGSVSQSKDWWTALYYDADFGPTSELIKEEDRYIWQATFEGPAGIYEWNPYMKSLDGTTMNGNVGDVSWEGDNLSFIISPDGEISGDNILLVNIDETEYYQLTLKLDASDLEIDPAGIHVTGSFNAWSPDATLLIDEKGDGIYSVTLSLPTNTQPYQYKFLNGNDWGKEETVFGECAYRSNRMVWLRDKDVELNPVTFGNCGFNPLDKIRVSCIGDSNTEGAGVTEPWFNSWPVQIREFLGDDYHTENFGVSGATLMAFPDPWGAWTNDVSNCYSNNKLFNPDVILIALGSNDSKTGYWGTRDFKADYVNLISEFKEFSSDPDIYMIIPVKAYSNDYEISDENIRNGVIPIIRELSKELMLPVIDWYSITQTLNREEYFPDGVHANEITSGMMAEKAAQILLAAKPTLKIDGEACDAYAEYRWYRNGEYLESVEGSVYETTEAGTYNVAVKLNATTDDIIISEPLEAAAGITLGVEAGETSISVGESENNIILYVKEDHLIIKGVQSATLEVYDLTGVVVEKNHINNLFTSVSVSNLPKGIYCCKVTDTHGKTLVRKIIR